MSSDVSLKLPQGATWRQKLRLKTGPVGARVARNLTGWKVRGSIRKRMADTAAVATFDSDDATVEITPLAGEIVFVLDSVSSAALPTENKECRWVFDFELYDDGEVPELVERKPGWTLPVVVTPNVTR